MGSRRIPVTLSIQFHFSGASCKRNPLAANLNPIPAVNAQAILVASPLDKEAAAAPRVLLAVEANKVKAAAKVHREPTEIVDALAAQARPDPTEIVDAQAAKAHRDPTEIVDVQVAAKADRDPTEIVDVQVAAKADREPTEIVDVQVAAKADREPTEIVDVQVAKADREAMEIAVAQAAVLANVLVALAVPHPDLMPVAQKAAALGVKKAPLNQAVRIKIADQEPVATLLDLAGATIDQLPRALKIEDNDSVATLPKERAPKARDHTKDASNEVTIPKAGAAISAHHREHLTNLIPAIVVLPIVKKAIVKKESVNPAIGKKQIVIPAIAKTAIVKKSICKASVVKVATP
jgi:hypothetical protein